MAITTSVSGEELTLNITRTADKTKASDLLDSAARYIYINRGMFNEVGEVEIGTTEEGVPIIGTGQISYDNLTNKQKLDIIEKYFIYELKEAGKRYDVDTARNAAVIAANEDANTNQDI